MRSLKFSNANVVGSSSQKEKEAHAREIHTCGARSIVVEKRGEGKREMFESRAEIVKGRKAEGERELNHNSTRRVVFFDGS